MIPQLSGNVVLVPASNGGLGRASIEVFERENATVVVNGRDAGTPNR